MMNFRNLLKSSFVAGIISCTSFSASAQGAYVKLGGGYNFGQGSTNYFQTFRNGNYLGSGIPNGFLTFKEVEVNPGKGSTVGGAIGYMFNANIGVEVGVNYLAGAESKAKHEDPIISPGFGNINFPITGVSAYSANTEIFTTKSQLVLVKPSIIITAGLPKFNPYMHMGVVLAKGSLKNSYLASHQYNESIKAEDTYFGGTGFGFQGALGLAFKLNDKFEIYSESAFNYLTYTPEKGKLISYTHNGVDLMPSFNTSQKEINFEEQTVSSNDPRNTSVPSIGPEQQFSLNSISINLGLKFNF